MPLKLCAYPEQKKKPDDLWLHGEECIVAELRIYMADVRRCLEPTNHKQKREFRDGEETRILKVSSCNHCGKEYSESDFWWTVSRDSIAIEIREGFHHSSYQARDCYFCSEDCVVAVVKVFIGTQMRTLPEEAWETYELASLRSARLMSVREATAGCRETRRGGGLRYILPGEPDYEYSVPLQTSALAGFVLSNAGFDFTIKDGHQTYVRTRPPGEWIKGWPIPTAEQLANACATYQKMGFQVRRSGNQITEIIDSVYEGYPNRVAPKQRRTR